MWRSGVRSSSAPPTHDFIRDVGWQEPVDCNSYSGQIRTPIASAPATQGTVTGADCSKAYDFACLQCCAECFSETTHRIPVGELLISR